MNRTYSIYIKRLFDFALSLIALFLLFPIFLIVTVFLHFANKGAGAFFLQERPGKHGKIFKVVKFKSMTDERDENGLLLPDMDRLTKVGKFVRATSIDELPQLLNVLVGDMSLIGPRPLLVEFLPLYSKEQARRHEVTPGITGWAQVNGRGTVTYSQKFMYDIWYVDHISFGLDCRILWMTIRNILKRKDIGNGDGDDKEVDDLGWAEIIDNQRRAK